MEGLLTQEESVLKVAVKTMKSKSSTKKHPAKTTANHKPLCCMFVSRAPLSTMNTSMFITGGL